MKIQRFLASFLLLCLSSLIPLRLEAQDPLGTAVGTPATCPTGGVAGTSCWSLVVTCPNVSNFTVSLKVSAPSVTPLGLVLFTAGGGGAIWYDRAFTYGATAIQNVINAGFTAIQTRFPGSGGWLAGPGGPRALACRYATTVQWVHDNLLPAATPLCATGQSGGGGAVGYALSHYGLGNILSMVETTSSPVYSRVDYGCICTQPKVSTPCNANPLSYCFGLITATNFVDPAYPDDICSDAVETHDPTNQTTFFNDSVASSDATFSYPTTDVHVVLGGLDIAGGAPPQALAWQTLITSKSSVVCVADAPHAIANVLDGATQISNDIISYCRLQ